MKGQVRQIVFFNLDSAWQSKTIFSAFVIVVFSRSMDIVINKVLLTQTLRSEGLDTSI